MFYFYSILVFLISQAALIVTRPINVYPELFYYPWLVARGLMPYRDFFDHHGFLPYYVLAPLSVFKSTIAIQLFYFFIQSTSLLLLLAILKKTGSRFIFFLCGALYLLLTYYLSGNNIWFENVICLLYLGIYYIMITEKIRYKYFILGFLVAMSSFVKPNAAIIILPVLFGTKNIRIVMYFALFWLIALFYFFVNHGLYQLLNNLFVFNFYVAKVVREQNQYFLEKSFLEFSLVVLVAAVGFLMLHKRLTKHILLFFFLFCSLLFLLNAAQTIYLVTASAFFVIFLGNVLKNIKPTHRFILIGFVLLYSIFLLRKDKHQYVFFHKNPTYIQNQVSENIVAQLKKMPLVKIQIYVLGNQVEIYYLLDQLPPTYFSVNFPFIAKYYKVEERIISDLRLKKVTYIVIPKPFDQYYVSFAALKQYIIDNYKLERSDVNFELYVAKVE